MEPEKQLFVLVKQGQKMAFEQLFKTYYAPLCLFAHNYLKDKDNCEEVVQSFFLKLWEKRSAIDINTSVKSYLFSSVRNACLNHIKHQKIIQIHQTEMLNTSSEADFSPEYFMEIGLAEKIEAYINELPPKRKEIFMLSREQGLKYREIADQLGISVKTVEAQMGQALKDLREKLRDYKHLLLGFLLVNR